MKIECKECKSDILWKNYQRLVLIMDRTDPNSKEWKYLNKIGWKLIENYIDALLQEFMKNER